MVLPAPRVQTIAIFAVCAVIVAAVAAYSGTFQSKNEDMNQNYLATNQFVTTAPAISADLINSTSTDWKKSFFGLNGTSTKINLASSTNKAGVSEKLTDTEIFGRNLFVSYAQLQQSGLADNSDAVNSAASKAVTDAVTRITLPVKYTESDLIMGDSNTANLNTYNMALLRIIKNGMPTQNETIIADTALQNKDMAMLKDIDPVISLYENTIFKLKSLSVPRVIATYHLEIMNSINLLLFSARALRNVEKDPITALAGVGQEKTAFENMLSALSKIDSYINSTPI